MRNTLLSICMVAIWAAPVLWLVGCGDTTIDHGAPPAEVSGMAADDAAALHRRGAQSQDQRVIADRGRCDGWAGCPLKHFYPVSSTLFRGSPAETWDAMQFLHDMSVHTVISLEDYWTVSHASIEQQKMMAHTFGLQFMWLPLSPIFPLDRNHVADILDLMGNPRNQPLYLSCKFGRERTGFLIALHRVVNDHWSPDAAHAEMMSYGFRPYLTPVLHAQFHRWVQVYLERGTLHG